MLGSLPTREIRKCKVSQLQLLRELNYETTVWICTSLRHVMTFSMYVTWHGYGSNGKLTSTPAAVTVGILSAVYLQIQQSSINLNNRSQICPITHNYVWWSDGRKQISRCVATGLGIGLRLKFEINCIKLLLKDDSNLESLQHWKIVFTRQFWSLKCTKVHQRRWPWAVPDASVLPPQTAS